MSGASFHLEFNLQGSGFEYPIQFNSWQRKERVGVLHRRYQLGVLLSNYTFKFDAHSFLLPPAICVTMCSIRLSLPIFATKLRNDTGVTRTMHGSLSSMTLDFRKERCSSPVSSQPTSASKQPLSLPLPNTKHHSILSGYLQSRRPPALKSVKALMTTEADRAHCAGAGRCAFHTPHSSRPAPHSLASGLLLDRAANKRWIFFLATQKNRICKK
jgi:hypothetical protein